MPLKYKKKEKKQKKWVYKYIYLLNSKYILLMAAVASAQKKKSERTYGKDYMESALTNPYNIFMTIHGGPLSYSSETTNEPIEGIVPEGCILILITPPQAVIFSSPTEDTETLRFFQQKNWIKTLLGPSSSTCYGADNYVDDQANEKKTPDDDVKMESSSEEEGSSEEGGSSEEENSSEEEMEEDGVYKEGEEYEWGKVRKTPFTLDKECDDAIFHLTKEEIAKRKNFFKRKQSNPTENGFELLNNMQIFLPGDNFYNQFQQFDDKSHDFDAYYIGEQKKDYRLPLSGDKKDEVLFFPAITLDGTWDPTYPVDSLVRRITEEGKEWKKDKPITATTHKPAQIHSHGANRVPYYNRTHPFAYHENAASPKTTQQLLNYIMKKEHRENDLPKIIILNSCSPSREISEKRSTQYSKILASRDEAKKRDMIKNLSIRGRLFLQGRKRFCALRIMVKTEENKDGKGTDIKPLLPYWRSHQQFARIDEDDLKSTYKFIGDLFKAEHEARLVAIERLGHRPLEFELPPQTINEELFIGLYTVAATNKRQKVMMMLRENWSSLFGGDHQQPHSWKNKVKRWTTKLQEPLPGGATSKPATQGGRKKRKTTRKKRRRYKKKTRRTKGKRKKKSRKKKRRRKTKKKK